MVKITPCFNEENNVNNTINEILKLVKFVQCFNNR